MKPVINLLLKNTFSIKQLLMSSEIFRNAVTDDSNNNGFTGRSEYKKMNGDQIRVDAYQKAIAKHIKPEHTVLDLGRGGGILALLAAASNPKKIYSIDHSDFIEVAKEIAGKVTDYPINFQKINSRSFNPPEKLDVILHEQTGVDLFEEDIIENLLDLKRRVLKKGGKIFPGKFELYIEPFSLKPEFRVPFREGKEKNNSYRFINAEPSTISRYLCSPKPALSIDLNDENFTGKFTVPRQKKAVENAGLMDGACIFFRVIFDDEISFSTSPLHGKTSSGNHYFRTRKKFCEPGKTLTYDINMDQYFKPETWELNFVDTASSAFQSAG